MRSAIRTIVMCLLLGAATAIIIASIAGLFVFGWGVTIGGTFWGVIPGSSPQPVSRGSASGSRIVGFGASQVVVRNSLTLPQPGDAQVVLGFLGDVTAHEVALITDSLSAGARVMVATETGWPWIAFACEFSDVGGHRGGWMIGRPRASGGPVRALAWRPLWPGAALNMLVFAAGWLVILLAPRAIRRTRRRRRGACERCGYDLRGTPSGGCPECGFARAE